MTCAECLQPLLFQLPTGHDAVKLCVLWPCGHQLHHCCAEFRRKRLKLSSPMMVGDASENGHAVDTTTRCPSCDSHVKQVTPLFFDGEGAPGNDGSRSDAFERFARVTHLQRKLLMRSRDVSNISATVVNLTRTCASLHSEKVTAVAEMEALKEHLPSTLHQSTAAVHTGPGHSLCFSEMDFDGLRKYLSQTAEVSRELQKRLLALRSANMSRRSRLEALRSELAQLPHNKAVDPEGQLRKANPVYFVDRDRVNMNPEPNVNTVVNVDDDDDNDDDPDVVILQPQNRKPRIEAEAILLPRSTQVTFHRTLQRDLPRPTEGLIQASLDQYSLR